MNAIDTIDHAGFWGIKRPPRSILYPHEYRGEAELCVACTQTDLSTSAQKKLVSDWCAFLPTLSNVRFLWFKSLTTQELFDAACSMRALEGLWVKWSRITNIESLPELKALSYFHLGSSTQLESIVPLGRMASLSWLGLEQIKSVRSLEPLQPLTQLVGLEACGSMGATWAIESLAPLAALASLEWLSIGKLDPSDKSLRSLSHLKDLRFLHLGNKFPMEEYAWLSRRLPTTACERFAPYVELGASWGIRCKKCNNSEGTILFTGNRKPMLCKYCDTAKIEKHLAEFIACSNAA